MISPQSILTEGTLANALAHGEQSLRERAGLKMLRNGIDYDDARRVLDECLSGQGELDDLIDDLQWELAERRFWASQHVEYGTRIIADLLARIRQHGRPTAGLCRICERFDEHLCVHGKLCQSCADERGE
jgi:hypothetical protein